MEENENVQSNNLCRTCLSTTADLTSLFTQIKYYDKGLISLKSILLTCTDNYINENDEFSTYICALCINKLIQAYTFREMCNESLKKLKEIYSNVSDNNKIVCPQFENDAEDSDIPITEAIDAVLCSFEEESARKNYSCENCSKEFSSQYFLDCHNKTSCDNDLLQCRICNKKFTRATDVKRHMFIHTGEKPFNCFVCNNSFNQSGLLSQHMKKIHNIKLSKEKKEKNSHLCSICGKLFTNASNLTIHVRRHIGDKPYACKMCSLSFVSNGRLKSHMRVHTGERPFVCNICGKSFAQSSVYGKHMKLHSGQRPYCCDFCSKTFTTAYELKIHKRLHTGEKPHVCNVCQKAFSDPKNLKHHKLTHSDIRPYLCGTCGKNFRRNHHLKKHMKIHLK